MPPMHHFHRFHHLHEREDGLEKALVAGGVLAGAYVLYRLWERKKGGGRHLVGADVGCGPESYWDSQSGQCVPLSFPSPPVAPPPACPDGQFYDYFQQACVPLAGVRAYYGP